MNTSKKMYVDSPKQEMEICVLCGDVTDTPKNQNINYRQFYIEGAGQLCRKCGSKNVFKNEI